MATILLYEETFDTGPELGQGTLLQALEFDVTTDSTHGISARITEHPAEKGVAFSDHVRPNLRRLSLHGLITNTPLNDATLTYAQIPEGARNRVSNVAPLRRYDHPEVIEVITNRQLQPGKVTLPKTDALRFPGVKPGFTPASAEPGTWTTDSTFMSWRIKGSYDDAKQDRVKAVFDILVRLCANGTLLTVITDLETLENMVIEDLSAPTRAEDSILFEVTFREFRFGATQHTKITPKPKPKEKRAEAKKEETPASKGYPPVEEEDPLVSVPKRAATAAGDAAYDYAHKVY